MMFSDPGRESERRDKIKNGVSAYWAEVYKLTETGMDFKDARDLVKRHRARAKEAKRVRLPYAPRQRKAEA